MKNKLVLVAISAATLAVYVDSHAMIRAPRVATQRVSIPKIQRMSRVPQRSYSFKQEAALFLAQIKEEAKSHKNHIKKQLSEDHAELNQMKIELNQFKKDLSEGRIHPQEIVKHYDVENDKDRNEEYQEIEQFKFGISLELSEAEIELCKATNNMKKYHSVDLDKLLNHHQELFIEDSLDVQKLDLGVWKLKEQLNSINEFHQMKQDVNELERNAKFALSNAVKNQKLKSIVKPKC